MKLLNKRVLAVLSLLLSTSAIGGMFGKSEPPKPLGLQASTNRAAAFKNLIDDGASLRHVPKPYSGASKNVAIGSLVFEFITDTGATANNEHFMDKDLKASITANYKLLGVTPETFQAIADNFQEGLRKALMDQGYTVLEQDKLLANKDYASWVADATAPQKSGMFSKDGFIKVVSKNTADTSGITGALKDISLSKAMGDIPVIKADIIVNFAKFENTTSIFDALGSSPDLQKNEVQTSLASQVLLTISPNSTFSITTNSGAIPYPILRTTVLPGQIAAKVDSQGETGGQMAASIALSLLSLGKSNSNTTNYEVTAVNNYREVVSDDLKMFAEVLANGLQKQ